MIISRRASVWLGGAILALLFAVPIATAQDKLRLTVANGNPPTIPSTWWMTDYIGPKLTEYSRRHWRSRYYARYRQPILLKDIARQF